MMHKTVAAEPSVLGCFMSQGESFTAPPVWKISPSRHAPFAGLMGIVNVTPDSFSDGGHYASVQAAVAHGVQLAHEGAFMLDVGAESSRPFAAPVPEAQEAERLLPVLAQLKTSCPDTLFSVDTYKASIAKAALEQGVHVVNDISACQKDPALYEVLASYKPGYVLMHSQGSPETMQLAPTYNNVVDDILAFFEAHMKKLVQQGLPEEHIVLDPGIGFGKTAEHSLEILQHIERFHTLGRPLYVGLSMKSLFGDLLGIPLAERGEATRMAVVYLAQHGVRYHRVHHVQPAHKMLALACMLEKAKV